MPNDPRMDGLVREVLDQDIVAIDTETTGLCVFRDAPLYWSMAWGDRNRCAMPISTLPYFQQSFQDPTKAWAFANAKFDAHMLANAGFTLEGHWYDIQVMHALLYEEESHRLKDVAKSCLGWSWRDFFDVFKPQLVPDYSKPVKILKNGKMSQPTRAENNYEMLTRAEHENLYQLVDYASNDAFGTLRLFEHLRRELEATNIYSLYSSRFRTMADLFFMTEAPYTKVLWKVERNGFYADKDYLVGIGGPMGTELDELARDMQRLWHEKRNEVVTWWMSLSESQARAWLGLGHTDPTQTPLMFNPNSVDQLRAYFIEWFGLKPLMMTKGGKSGVKQASIDKGFLEHYEGDSEMAHQMLRHRKLSKLKGTYIDNIDEFRDNNGRIHTKYNQDVARCMPAGELVLTSRGYLPVEAVMVGDQVITHTGKTRHVTECSKHAPMPIYRVQLSNGLVLRTNSEHPYRVGETWVPANELRPGTLVSVYSGVECWKNIPDWAPFEVSSWGRVRNALTGHVRVQQPKGQWGHLKVSLARNGAQQRGVDRKDFSVHRLVAAAFHAGAGEIRHLNGIAWDNTVGNLRYGTSLENRQDALRHGTMSQRRAGRTILTAEDVAVIRTTPLAGQPPSSTAKLTQEIADALRARATGERGEAAAFAQELGVSHQAITNILQNRTHTRKGPTHTTAAQLAEQYGISEGYIRELRSGVKWQSEDYIEGSFAKFYEVTVTGVTLGHPETVYGLTVEEDHSHVTGGIVTHNTGRLSSSDPNLQNIPQPDKDKFKLRGAFRPQPGAGTCLIVGDYSQLEMRLLACATVTTELPGGAEDMIQIFLDGKDIHMGNAAMVFGPIYLSKYGWSLTYDFLKEAKKIDGQVKEGKLPKEALTEAHKLALLARNNIKAVGFGLNYGLKEKKLGRQLGISKEAALEIIEAYMATYPAVKKFYADSIAEARLKGCSWTVLGRRRCHPAINSSNTMDRWSEERKACNMPIQGSASDVVRMAMLRIDEARLDLKYGCHMILQVHDELGFECPIVTAPAARDEIKELMEHALFTDLVVPLEVSIGMGERWDQAK